MVLKITNLHILRYLPTYWLYLLERYTIDNQRFTHTVTSSTCAFPLRFQALDDAPCFDRVGGSVGRLPVGFRLFGNKVQLKNIPAFR